MRRQKHADRVDFSECKFIEENMQFYTYIDFCNNCDAIKRLFHAMTDNGKIFYHYYVYANTHMKLNFKDAIIDFLYDYDDKRNLMKLKKQYKIGRQKRS